MLRRTGRLRRFGLRLALIALAIQTAIPFLIAFELRAYAAAQDAAVFDQPLCLHNAPANPTERPTHRDCNLACPLCSALAASHMLALVGQGVPGVRPIEAIVLPRFVEDWASARSLFFQAYRSRAPPLI